MKTYQFYAGGAWHGPASGKWIDSEDPATEEIWARVPDCNAEDVSRAVEAAADCFRAERRTAAERARLLRRMGEAIARNAERLGAVETQDNGKLPAHITPALTGWLNESFDYYAGMIDNVDQNMGRLIKKFDELGVSAPPE